MKDKKILLSTLWIFVTVNYIFCDVLSFINPSFIQMLLDGGELLGTPVNEKFLFYSALFMEIPFAMILLSRVLKQKWNRVANIIAGSIMTLAQIASLFVGETELHYAFYSIIEIGTSLSIIWIAWKWK